MILPNQRQSLTSQLLQSLQQPLIQYLLLFLAVMCVHLPTLWYTYVWDDYSMILRNHFLREWKYVPRYFTDPSTFAHDPGNFRADEWRPLRNLYYLFTFKTHKFHPAGWHFQHVLLHSCVASLLLILFHRLYRYAMAWPPSSYLPVPAQVGVWLAVALWAVHPVNTEVTAWLKSADDLLACFFTLLSLIILFPSDAKVTNSRAAAAAGLFALAFLSKASITPLPVIYPALVLILAPSLSTTIRHKPTWNSALLLWLGLFLFLVLRKQILGKLEQVPYMAGSFSLMMATMTTALVRYLQLVIWPFWPTVQIGDYHGWYIADSWFHMPVLISIAILLPIIIISAAAAWRSKVFAAGMAFTILAFLPVANIIPMMQVLADRFLYFPLMGAALCISILIAHLIRQDRRFIWLPIVGFIALSAENLNWQRVWVDNETFQKNNLANLKHNSRARFNIAGLLVRDGKTTEAVSALQLLYADHPDHLDAGMLLADLLYRNGQTSQSLELLKKLMHHFPLSPRPSGYLGDLARLAGQYEVATKYYDHALQRNQQIPSLWYWRGMMYKRAGHYSEATKSFRMALQLNDKFTSASLELNSTTSE